MKKRISNKAAGAIRLGIAQAFQEITGVMAVWTAILLILLVVAIISDLGEWVGTTISPATWIGTMVRFGRPWRALLGMLLCAAIWYMLDYIAPKIRTTSQKPDLQEQCAKSMAALLAEVALLVPLGLAALSQILAIFRLEGEWVDWFYELKYLPTRKPLLMWAIFGMVVCLLMALDQFLLAYYPQTADLFEQRPSDAEPAEVVNTSTAGAIEDTVADDEIDE